MKKTVKLLNNEISVDVRKFLDGKLLLQANTGGGKSYAIRRIVEQLYDVVPVIILDTEGEFSTLRQKFDYILIGRGHEITADHRSAGLLAHKLIESRVSAVIDLFEMKPYEREMFVKNFTEAMTNAPRSLWLPTLLVVDEAQTYAPEGDKTETGRALHDAAFKFRKRRYGVLFATPRIAALSKNVISTCKNKLIGYTSLDIDVKRAGGELGFTTKDQLRSLRDLDPGRFFAFGPAFSKEVITVQIGPVQTQHGDEGDAKIEAIKPSEKVKKALAILAAVPQAAEEEAKTIEDFKKKVRALEHDLKVRNKAVIRVEDPKAIEKEVARRMLVRDREVTRAVELRDRLWKADLNHAQDEIRRLMDKITRIGKVIGLDVTGVMPIFEGPADKLSKGLFSAGGKVKPTPDGKPLFTTEHPPEMKKMLMSEEPYRPSADNVEVVNPPLIKASRAVLSYLASVYPQTRSKSQLWVATGYAPGGGFDTAVYALTGRNLIQKMPDGKFQAVHPFDESLIDRSFDPSLDKWQNKLIKASRSVLNLLLKDPYTGLTKQELAERTGYAMGGGFDTAIYSLTGKDLVIKEGNTFIINPEILEL